MPFIGYNKKNLVAHIRTNVYSWRTPGLIIVILVTEGGFVKRY